MVTKVSGVMLEDGAVADADTGFTSGNYVRVAVDGTLEERTPTQVNADLVAVGTGTVTSVNLADSTGLTASGGPITGAGALTYTLSANLQAWHGLATSAKQNADTTLTALAGANWASNSLAIGSGTDTVAQVTFAANTFPGRSSTGNLVAKTITDAAFSVLDDATTGAMLTTLGAQPLDATLTALAGQNWAANAMPLGSGADTMSQLSLGVNTIPGRSSTGNVVAKPVTDSAFAALANVMSGTYTPTITNIANASASTAFVMQWMRVGNIVTVSGQFDVDPTTAASTLTQIEISLPVASNFSASTQLAGTACGNSVVEPCLILANPTTDTAAVNFLAVNAANHAFSCHFTYQVI